MGTLESSVVILLWLVVISLVTSLLLQWLVFSRFRWVLWRLQSIIVSLTLPGVILTPLILLFGFSFIHIDLTFPSALFASPWEQGVYLIFPAMILYLISGFLWQSLSCLIHDYESWSRQPFVSFGRSLGMGADQQLRKILLLKPWLQAFVTCLPWICSEIIIVECILNIPGLGFELWQAVKSRQHYQGLELLFSLLVLYGGINFIAKQTFQWVGRKIEGY